MKGVLKVSSEETYEDDNEAVDVNDETEAEEEQNDNCEQNESSSSSGGDDFAADPMNIYLREMGELDLLTYHEEIALAKKIEEGESRVQNAVLQLSIGLEALNTLQYGLTQGGLRIGSVLNGISDNDDNGLAAIREDFLKATERAFQLDEQRTELFQKLKEKLGSMEDEDRLTDAIRNVGLEIAGLFQQWRISYRSLLPVIKEVEDFNKRFREVRIRARRELLLASRTSQLSG